LHYYVAVTYENKNKTTFIDCSGLQFVTERKFVNKIEEMKIASIKFVVVCNISKRGKENALDGHKLWYTLLVVDMHTTESLGLINMTEFRPMTCETEQIW